jgi:2-C-methyl-D-erythritol 4-phosphate cytidylyltransferase
MGSFDRPKQYLTLCGRPLIEWAVAPLLEHVAISAVVVAVAPDDPFWNQTSLAAHSRVRRVAGGAERADSVRAGIAALAGEAASDDWVLVHDAARPCLPAEDVERLMTDLADHPVGGLLATPVVDTLKRADAKGCVAQTVPREGLWRALTPQMFRFGVLERALRTAAERSVSVTDEAQAVELLGLAPKLVPGSADNLKVTTPPDLECAAQILASRRAS